VKTILFTGIKGGTGKTTLAAAFSAFLFNEKATDKITLMGFDFQRELSFLAKKEKPEFDVIECNYEDFITVYENEIKKETQYLIIDCGFQPIKYYQTILNNSNIVVLPFLHTELDVVKLFGFGKIIRINDRKRQGQIFYCLPNFCHVNRDNETIIHGIDKSLINQGFNLTPYINHISKINYFGLSKKHIYIFRSTFIKIINNF